MLVAGLDLGTVTGWAVFSWDKQSTPCLQRSSVYKTKRAMEHHGAVGRWYAFRLLLNEHMGDADVIFYEDVPVQAHTGGIAARVWAGLFATLELWAFEHEKNLVPVTIQAAKSALTRKANAAKSEMLEAAGKMWPDLRIETHDQADALGVAVAGMLKIKRGTLLL